MRTKHKQIINLCIAVVIAIVSARVWSMQPEWYMDWYDIVDAACWVVVFAMVFVLTHLVNGFAKQMLVLRVVLLGAAGLALNNLADEVARENDLAAGWNEWVVFTMIVGYVLYRIRGYAIHQIRKNVKGTCFGFSRKASRPTL